jgi:hypothetical protein
MILANIAILLALAWFFFKQHAGDYPRLFWIALVYKSAMAVALGLVYRYYYSANDTWLFFEDATKLADFARMDFELYVQFLLNSDTTYSIWNELANTQARSLFLVKLISIFSLITGKNYWISAVYFAFISFTASWYLFRIVTKHVQQSKTPAALAFLFFPSVVFWGSGLVKETLALAGIYFIAAIFIKVVKADRTHWPEWFLMVISFYIAWSLKYYWTALFMAVVTTSVLTLFFTKRVVALKTNPVVTWVGIFLILVVVASTMHPNFYLSRFLDVLITNHNDFVRISKPEGLIHYYQLTADWWSVCINAPWALISGLFRPVVWEASGAAATVAAIENLFLLVLVFSSLFREKDTTSQQLLFYSTIVYVALLCIFLALSTPNLGTLSRYRIGFLPFLVFVVSYRNPLLQYLFSRIRLLRPWIIYNI